MLTMNRKYITVCFKKINKTILPILPAIFMAISAGCSGHTREVTALWPDAREDTGQWSGSNGVEPQWPGSGQTETATVDSLPGGTAGQQGQENTEREETWAIYWYLCGSDLESWAGCATADLEEMIEVTLPEHVKVVIETGGAMEWLNDIVSADTASRYLYTGNTLAQVDKQPVANMGDPDTLVRFLEFCNSNYPADHQAVVFWNHGGGSLSGIAFDERYDYDSLTLPELKAAFEAVPAVSGSYELIGFDACLMATVDVADILKDHAKYMVASQEIESGIGWDYNGFMAAFADGGPADGAELGRAICDTFYRACEIAGCAELSTLSVVDLGKAAALLDAYRQAGEEILLDGCLGQHSYLRDFIRAAREAQNYGGNTRELGYYHMVDLGDFFKHMDGPMMPESRRTVLAALDECVLYQVKGPLRAEASGLSCFYNYGGIYDSGVESIEQFQELGTSKDFGIYYQYVSHGYMGTDDTAYVEELASAAGYDGFTPNQDLFQWSPPLDGFPITGDAEIGWFSAVREEDVQYMSEVRLEIIREDAETGDYIFYGDALTAEMSENGSLRGRLPSGWGALDGVPLCMEPIGKYDRYNLYASPVLLNGEPYRLCIGESEEGFILVGAQRAHNLPAGMAIKELRKLVIGDIIEPLFMAADDLDSGYLTEVTVGKVVISGNSRFTAQEFPDGRYRVRFRMIDYAGNSYFSQSAEYSNS